MKIFGFNCYRHLSSTKKLEYSKKWTWKPANKKLIKNPKSLLRFSETFQTYLESSFSKGYSLLISKKGTSVGSLIQKFKNKKKPFLYVNWDLFLHEGVIHYDQSRGQFQLRYKKNVIDLSKVKSIYFDYADIQEVLYFKRSKFSNKEKVFLARWVDVLNTLEFVCRDAIWLPSKPSMMNFERQNKFGESLLASELGLEIPNMIYTNEPREAQKFLFHNESIIKESGLKFFDEKKKVYAFFSKLVDPLDKDLTYIQYSPCFFQEYIPKDYDIRAVVVGKKIFTIRIESQKYSETRRDWRGNAHLTPMKEIKLPKKIQKKLLDLTKELKMNLATIDLVQKKDAFYFLEINRPGQWFFLEILSGAKISQAIVSQM